MKAYVDWFVKKGVQVLLIPYDTTEHEKYMSMVHGLLLPGGETGYLLKNRAFLHSITRFVELSLQPGIYFPIWGTCLGFEMLLTVIGGVTTFKKYVANGLYPIQLTPDGKDSRLFHSFSPRSLHFLEHAKSTLQHHDYGMSVTDFMNNPHLTRFYRILATSIDQTGKEYIAAIEGKYYPIYGVSWHPERQSHSGSFCSFFLSELRKNKRTLSATCASLSPTNHSLHRCSHYTHLDQHLCYFFKS
jgi:gamma-glutamyl hydrolase